MSKVLVIELRVELPEGLFENSAAIAKAQGIHDQLQSAAREAFGDAATLKVDTFTPKPRAAAPANGANEPTARRGRRPAAEQANGKAHA